MKKSIFAVMIVFGASHILTSTTDAWGKQDQSGRSTFKGIVMDFVTKSRIAGATISIEETGLEGITNEKGEYGPTSCPPGVYTVRVAHPQYRSLICKNFNIPVGGGVDAAFTLKSGKPEDRALILDQRSLGDMVIDEDAEPIEKVEPVYPESALKDKVEGTVLLNVYVTAEGEVGNAWVGQGVREDLNRAALEAIQNFKFKPAKVKGKPVSVPISIPFNFKLADKSTKYPLHHLEGPLTPDDVKQALAYLGVEMERFTYDLPYKHNVRFSLDQYLDGKLADSKSWSINPQPGKCSILVLKYQDGDSIRYTINVASGNGRRSISLGKIPIKGFNASGTQRMADIGLQSGIKVPIYLFALSPGGVSFRFGDSLEQIIARIKLVTVISSELRLE